MPKFSAELYAEKKPDGCTFVFSGESAGRLIEIRIDAKDARMVECRREFNAKCREALAKLCEEMLSGVAG